MSMRDLCAEVLRLDKEGAARPWRKLSLVKSYGEYYDTEVASTSLWRILSVEYHGHHDHCNADLIATYRTAAPVFAGIVEQVEVLTDELERDGAFLRDDDFGRLARRLRALLEVEP